MQSILQTLDKQKFLGFPIWEFSYRSLPRRYGRLFLWNIVLRYPLRTLKGLLAYSRFYRHHPPGQEVIQLFAGHENQWLQQAAVSEQEFLLALGYCQKPLLCPAGRFNHQCPTLLRTDLLTVEVAKLPSPCQTCDIRRVSTAALPAGATVYIMTSAEDIARHLFLPTLKGGRFERALFVQCAYSIPAMVLPLLICNLKAFIIPFNQGDCQDYPQFLAADVGIKDEQTSVTPENDTRLQVLLETLATKRQRQDNLYHRFMPDGELFMPVRA